MRDDLAASFSIPTPEDMGFLGNAFGANFVRPLLSNSSQHNCNVVAVYGPPESGKSRFLQHLGEGLGISNMKDFWSDSLLTYKHGPERKILTIGDSLFRRFDFGIFTYEVCNPYTMSKKWGAPLRNMDKKGMDVLEHPPMPHLRNSTVFVSIFNTRHPADSAYYFRDVAQSVQALMNGDPSFSEDCAEAIAHHYLEQAKETAELSVAHITEQHSCHEEGARIVTIVPLSTSDTIRTTFDNFKASIQHVALK